MAITTTAEMSDFITNNIKEAVLVVNNEPYFFWPGRPLHRTIQFENRVGVTGGDAQFEQYNELTTHPLTEGEDYNETQQFKPSSTTISSSEEGLTVVLTDKAQRQMEPPNSIDNWTAKRNRAALRAHMGAFDAALFMLAASLQSGVSDTGAVAQYGDIFDLADKLKQNSVPGPYAGVLHPQQWRNLVNESDTPITDASQTGEIATDLWQDYSIRKFANVNWIITNRVYDDGTDVYGAVWSANPDTSPFGAFIEKMPMPPAVERDETLRAFEITYVADWAAGVVDQHTGDSDATGYYIQTGNSATV